MVVSVLDNEDGDGSPSLHTDCSLLAAGCEHQEIIHNQINKLHFNIRARQDKALPRNCQNSQALSCSFQFVVTVAGRGGDC